MGQIRKNGIIYSGGPELIQPVIYSEEERCIGVWTDGKPLYQKTLVVPSVGSVGSSLITPIQINDIPFDFVTVINANIYDGNDKRWYPLSSLMKATTSRIFIAPYLNKDASPVVFYASLYTGGDTFSNLGEFNVTIQYTKSTDIAGDGDWTPSGVKAVHYSTNEHVIGTWIDGKTLYEKTVYSTSSLNYGQRNSISTGILDADEVPLITGSVSYGSNGSYLPLPYAEAGTNEVIKVGEFNKENGNIQIFVGTAYQSPYLVNKVILTIQYTKSS